MVDQMQETKYVQKCNNRFRSKFLTIQELHNNVAAENKFKFFCNMVVVKLVLVLVVKMERNRDFHRIRNADKMKQPPRE